MQKLCGNQPGSSSTPHTVVATVIFKKFVLKNTGCLVAFFVKVVLDVSQSFPEGFGRIGNGPVNFYVKMRE